MPKVVSRSAVSASTDAHPTASSAAALRVYYCICGEFILVIDKSLASLPRRQTDNAIIIRSQSSDAGEARVFKLNATYTDPIILESSMVTWILLKLCKVSANLPVVNHRIGRLKRLVFLGIKSACFALLSSATAELLTSPINFSPLLLSSLSVLPPFLMSYGYRLSLLPEGNLSPHAFSIFQQAQSPRATHTQFEDLRQVLRPSARANARRKSSKPSSKPSKPSSKLSKLLGAI
ncbi:hypothetical protein ONZ45_g137 [Pleurotus djamor]|nr:hypothetical protein ONZ45_g137 [Pleurotus djamor]